MNKGIETGNRIKAKRAEVKRALKRNAMTLSEALVVEECQGMRLYELLVFAPVLWPSIAKQPRGSAKGAARKMLSDSGCTLETLVKDVGSRRRLLLKSWDELTS